MLNVKREILQAIILAVGTKQKKKESAEGEKLKRTFVLTSTNKKYIKMRPRRGALCDTIIGFV